MSSFKNDTKAKRYYWLQLKTDFFDQKEIKLLRKIAGGDTYTIIYLKMLLASLKDEGRLYFESIGDDFTEEIALLIDEDTENVAITLKFLEAKNLIEVIEDDEYLLNRVPEMVGSEAYSTERSRRHRARKKLQTNTDALQCNTDETERNASQLKDIVIAKEELKNNNIDQSSSKEADVVSLKNRFEALWKLYPKKQGKDKAFKSYQRAIKDGVEDETILNGLKNYLQQIEVQKTEQQFIKNGSTWFNQKCWDDEYITKSEPVRNRRGYEREVDIEW